MGIEELGEGGGDTMDGSDGRESALPVCAREWERKGGSQLQGSRWLAQVVHAAAPDSPAERKMQEKLNLRKDKDAGREANQSC